MKEGKKEDGKKEDGKKRDGKKEEGKKEKRKKERDWSFMLFQKQWMTLVRSCRGLDNPCDSVSMHPPYNSSSNTNPCLLSVL